MPLSPVPNFDIFRGRPYTSDVQWIESVASLAAAIERMNQTASEKPGMDFVFHVEPRLVMAFTDTTSVNSAARPEKSGAA